MQAALQLAAEVVDRTERHLGEDWPSLNSSVDNPQLLRAPCEKAFDLLGGIHLAFLQLVQATLDFTLGRPANLIEQSNSTYS
jgi:hypothetical protein